MSSYFSIDFLALFLALGAFLAYYLFGFLQKTNTIPSLAFSELKSLSYRSESQRLRFAHMPQKLYAASLFFLLLGFIDPHFMLPRSEPADTNRLPTEGIAIYLVLDQSGSMSQEVAVSRRQSLSKIGLLKQVTETFVQNRPDDLIGLVVFARVPHVLVPLTLDHQIILDQLKQLQVVQNPENDGTSMGYAIFKTANLIAATRHFAQELSDTSAPAYTIQNSIIVVMTDGLQDPNPLDRGNRLRTIELEDAATYARNEGIRLYIVNVDPTFSAEEFAPHRRLMQRITEMTGGKFYLADTQSLQQIYENINQLEKKQLPETNEEVLHSKAQLNARYQRFSLYPYFLALGLCFLAGFLILETTWLKRVP